MDVTVAVLAGGRGSRIGGDKALVELAGRPLISYPLQAARDAGLPAVIVAKPTTKLPPLDVAVMLEPDAPVHPLLGVLTALGELPAVIALPCDMPFIEPQALVALAEMTDDVATLWTGEPFPALYRRSVVPRLREAVRTGASVRSTQAQTGHAPAAITSMRPAAQLTVNTVSELIAAEQQLRRR